MRLDGMRIFVRVAGIGQLLRRGAADECGALGGTRPGGCLERHLCASCSRATRVSQPDTRLRGSTWKSVVKSSPGRCREVWLSEDTRRAWPYRTDPAPVFRDSTVDAHVATSCCQFGGLHLELDFSDRRANLIEGFRSGDPHCRPLDPATVAARSAAAGCHRRGARLPGQTRRRNIPRICSP